MTHQSRPPAFYIASNCCFNIQSGDMVYVSGFGWLESHGTGTVIYDEMIYENGNKVGSMG